MANAADWVEVALTDGVMNIGQIDKVTARKLDKLVDRGALLKCRGRFCGISPLKTIWCAPGVRVPIHEGWEVVKTCGSIAQEIRASA